MPNLNAPLPPMLKYVTHSQQNSPAKRRHLEAYAKAAVREALESIVKKARANEWIEPTCDGSIVTFPLEDIEAILKEYE